MFKILYATIAYKVRNARKELHEEKKPGRRTNGTFPGSHEKNIIILQQRILQQLHPNLLHSRMQQYNQDVCFGSLSSKHAPKRLDQG